MGNTNCQSSSMFSKSKVSTFFDFLPPAVYTRLFILTVLAPYRWYFVDYKRLLIFVTYHHELQVVF
uniref:Uncharacterized protein n=1 Tax=Ciona intestinalis TaxID=7719 RepID=H2XWB2_CIOIN